MASSSHANQGDTIVPDHVYKKIEVVGTSAEGQDAAIRNAIATAAKTVHNLRWYEVIESRGSIDGGKVAQYQVSLRIAFTLDE